MSLRQALRSGVAAVAIASVAAPYGAWATARGPAGLDVHVAQGPEFSRIEIHGAGAIKSRREGQTVTIVFPRDADPDIARLHTDPPRWVKGAEKRHVGGHLELAIQLADDADAKVGVADGAAYVNAFAKPPPAPAADYAAPAPQPSPEPPRPNPVPPGGVVHMDAKVVNQQAILTFAWANPAGLAVFRRGDVVWVVFDASAALDISKTPKGLRQFSNIQAFRGGDYAALRIDAAHDVPVFAVSQGATWTVAVGPGDQPQPTQINITRDDAQGPPILKAPVAGATRIIKLPDPVVGDVMTVVTALGPAKGLPSRRDYVQLALLPSIQGLAIESYIDDLAVDRSADIVHITRGTGGLALSPKWAIKDRELAQLGAPQPAAMPSLVDYDSWPKTGAGGFLARYNALLGAAAEEEAKTGENVPTAARMALARFLVGSELSFEAIGVLNEAAKAQPKLLDDAEFRGLRGVARVMARRYKEADADFSSPVLAEDPSSALWRAYVASQLAQWSEARAQFAKGAEAYALFPPVWKARFARADAQAALAQGDLVGAEARVRLALQEKTDPYEELATRLVQARVIELQGHKDRALRVYQAIATAPAEYLSAPAVLRATQIQLESGKITPLQAVNVFDGLRYRWRGDATELETIRALGQLYLSQGRFREALEALRSAGKRLPDLPEALQLQADLTAAFRSLFLDGYADGLEPVQALALFYDFKELTPIGADGDAMVRKLVRRLVDVDLLDQAADLLKYQADNRLDGVPKAQVATDLALIYLMDKKPEQAIQAINASRTTILPAALNAERRLIEARAWAGVGHYDSALEILEKDKSRDAEDLRAEITWKEKAWDKAGPLYERSLGDRWKTQTPLAAEDEGKLLRAGVAYSLSGDDAALTRLRTQYQAFIDGSHNPEALRIALAGVSTGRLSVADFGRVSADNQIFAGWVDKMKVRFREPRAPLVASKTAGPDKSAPPKPAAAPAKRAEGPTAAKG
ncbi:tetratricopeptide repeat protein [Phenylobacterium soli]|uniref:Endoglucanase n=1 Tax=Phenylobacterium soli TaxID=2170551 RepID=A0A328AJR9_9CAUL|nr:tetratricopeptide repeat protein [Phenylobacterium soli]RAK54665.1 endoglucanase [Phenylobacterium soli]